MAKRDDVLAFLKRNGRHIARIAVIMLLTAMYCVGLIVFRIGDGQTGMDALETVAVIVSVLFAILFVTVYVMLFVMKNVKTEHVFVVCTLIMGVIFLLIMPEFEAPDELVHIGNAYDLSSQILGCGGNETGYISMRKSDAYAVNDILSRLQDREGYNNYIQNLIHPDKLESEICKLNDTVTTYETFRYQYIIHALWFVIARLAGVSSIPMFFIGSVISLLLYTGCAFYAIRKMPFGKTALLCVTMFPMLLQQVTSYSYDVLVFSMAFILTALVFKFTVEGSLSVKETAIMWIAAALLAPAKTFAYVPLLLIIFIPLIKWRERYKKQLIAALIVLGVLVAAAVIYLAVKYCAGGAQDGEGTHIVSWSGTEGYTIGYILAHPKKSLGVIEETLLSKTDMYITTLLGNTLGWFQIGMSSFIVYTLGLMAIIASFPKEGEEKMLGGRDKLGFLIVAAIVVCCILTGMWIMWTPITYAYIEGVQGRYFLPIILLTLLIFRTKYISVKPGIDKAVIAVSLVMQPLVVLYILDALA